MTDLLTVRDLTVSRGGIAVLEGVGFTLAPCAALILRGPNGIGKTTLLRTIAGLQPPVSGTVSAPAGLAYAAHADGLKGALTVRENLTFWARLHGTAEIAPALGRMNLDVLADRPAATLSAGQKRRLGLARLLVTGAALWVMDEPTVSLDADSVALFGQVVRDHLAGGGGALIATHIDPGLTAGTLDLSPFRARVRRLDGFDEAFG
ncbi:heme ABC exporter ATP-binding protein CcmA [Sinirhodobacter populi]|uniref:Heme ABC exporter ATP-binding protein CcmA n=1 Tax=Paenirhodobacter populi TaxID=2306993 RepID=A0A443K245_9RHOB|nr:heme ABC exporter ATP-binding protein CcmA [Sinirhodobacter populi]RWR26838.1 heme ABC exporter ATP-binding protein CcmA [Sinirhodobacter populi]